MTIVSTVVDGRYDIQPVHVKSNLFSTLKGRLLIFNLMSIVSTVADCRCNIQPVHVRIYLAKNVVRYITATLFTSWRKPASWTSHLCRNPTSSWNQHSTSRLLALLVS